MKFKLNQRYRITFWDHCKGEDRILCEVTIWTTRDDATFIYGTWWKVFHDDSETEELNREMVSIAKSTIVKKKICR